MLEIHTQGEAIEAVKIHGKYVQEIPEYLMDYNLSVVCNSFYRDRLRIVPLVYQDLFLSKYLHLLINML